MMKKLAVFTLALTLAAGPVLAGSIEDRLAARNPVLSELRAKHLQAFKAAVRVIVKQETAQGLKPGGALPDAVPTGRDAGQGAGHGYTAGNPDILWLYNSSPEGMSDLISILKSAGQKPKT